MNQAETKHERFIRVAESRTNKILDLIRLLGNCSNRMNYEYTEDEVRSIFETIEKELNNAKRRYSFKDRDSRFSLRQ